MNIYLKPDLVRIQRVKCAQEAKRVCKKHLKIVNEALRFHNFL